MSDKIIEGNKLIAVFMGAFVLEPYVMFYDVEGRSEVPKGYPNDPFNKDMKLEYNTSWDWLMPVVERIESMGTIVEIWMSLGRGCRITKGSFKNPIQTIAATESNSTIEAVWLAVIEFIKWYRPDIKPSNNQTPTK